MLSIAKGTYVRGGKRESCRLNSCALRLAHVKLCATAIYRNDFVTTLLGSLTRATSPVHFIRRALVAYQQT
jgi:hypothetical protein